jgi:hypothetical protein
MQFYKLAPNPTYSNREVAEEWGVTTPGGGVSESETQYLTTVPFFNPLTDLGRYRPQDYAFGTGHYTTQTDYSLFNYVIKGQRNAPSILRR